MSLNINIKDFTLWLKEPGYCCVFCGGTGATRYHFSEVLNQDVCEECYSKLRKRFEIEKEGYMK